MTSYERKVSAEDATISIEEEARFEVADMLLWRCAMYRSVRFFPNECEILSYRFQSGARMHPVTLDQSILFYSYASQSLNFPPSLTSG
jgi:hypothetical protein